MSDSRSVDLAAEFSRRFDSAWKKAIEEEKDRMLDWEAGFFLDFMAITARCLKREVEKHSPGSAAIDFVAGNGLDRDPTAAVVARREYKRAFQGKAYSLTAENVEGKLIDFFVSLETTLQQRGVNLWTTGNE